MKVTVNEKTKKTEKPFPKLMIGKETGTVVLFSGKNCGTIILENKAFNDCGDYFTNLEIDGFTDFDGSITLENEE